MDDDAFAVIKAGWGKPGKNMQVVLLCQPELSGPTGPRLNGTLTPDLALINDVLRCYQCDKVSGRTECLSNRETGDRCSTV